MDTYEYIRVEIRVYKKSGLNFCYGVLHPSSSHTHALTHYPSPPPLTLTHITNTHTHAHYPSSILKLMHNTHNRHTRPPPTHPPTTTPLTLMLSTHTPCSPPYSAHTHIHPLLL